MRFACRNGINKTHLLDIYIYIYFFYKWKNKSGKTIRFVTLLLLGFCADAVNSFLLNKYFSIINVLLSPIWPTCACSHVKALRRDAFD